MNIEVNGIQITLTKEQLNHIESQKKKSPETLFKEFVLDKIDIHRPVIDFERFPHRIFYLDANGNYICDLEHQNGSFGFDHERVWNVFGRELNLKFDGIQEIMRVKVEEHFGLKGITPASTWAAWSHAVKEHFKNKLG